MCLNSNHHKQQYNLSSFSSKFYLFGAAEKRKGKQGEDRRKGTIPANGKGGMEGAKPEDDLREEGFLFLLLGSKITAPQNQRSNSYMCFPFFQRH